MAKKNSNAYFLNGTGVLETLKRLSITPQKIQYTEGLKRALEASEVISGVDAIKLDWPNEKHLARTKARKARIST